MIRVTLEGGVAHLVLDRPDKRNALTPEMLASLISGVTQIEATPARVLLLRGEGSVFCAGFDLTLCRDHPDGAMMRSLLSGLSEAIRSLRSQRRPVVIAAHGAAVAGGCALLGAGDVVITNDQARLGYPVVRLGVSPAVSAPFLRLRTAGGAARERLLDPSVITGKEAQRIGLVSRSVATPAEVHESALAEARALAEKPPTAMAATRRLIEEIEDVRETGWRALAVSLSLTGKDEERRLLPSVWESGRER